MYTSPPAVVQLHTTDRFVGINLPGLVPSYSNLNNMNFQGSYHIRCYRFPQNYYNFYPGDRYWANIEFIMNEDNGAEIKTDPFILFESQTYQQMTGHELINSFNETLNSKLCIQSQLGTTPLQRLKLQEQEIFDSRVDLSNSQPANANYHLTAQEMAFVAFDRLCTLTFDEGASKIVLRFDMINEPVIASNNERKTFQQDGIPPQYVIISETFPIKDIVFTISVDNTSIPSTKKFLKRAVGIPENQEKCQFIVPSSTIQRSQFIYESTRLNYFNAHRQISGLDISINIYNKLMSDMRRHLNVRIRSTMQSNLWSTDGNRLNTIRMFPFSGEVGKNDQLTHIDVTDTPSHIEMTDLRRSEIEICDEQGQPILFLEPYHLELGITFSVTRN